MLLTEKPVSVGHVCLVTVGVRDTRNSLSVLLLQLRGSVHVVNARAALYRRKCNVLSILILHTQFVLLIVTSKAMLLVNPSPFGLYCVLRTELDALDVCLWLS